MNKREQGFSPTFILMLMGMLLLVAAAGSYYYLKAMGKAPLPARNEQQSLKNVSQASPTPRPVTDDDDTETLEAELDATIIESPQDDFNQLDNSASQL